MCKQLKSMAHAASISILMSMVFIGTTAFAGQEVSGALSTKALELKDPIPARSQSIVNKLEYYLKIIGDPFGHTKRSCHAYAVVTNGVQVAKVNGSDAAARRGCGRSVVNRCRRRARDAARHCMAALRVNPYSAETRAACSVQAGVLGFERYSFKAQVQAAAKRIARSGQSVTLLGVTHGDTGCGWRDRKNLVENIGPVRVQ